jgi:hypothetical protein
MERRRLFKACVTTHAVEQLGLAYAKVAHIKAAVEEVTGEKYQFVIRDYLELRGVQSSFERMSKNCHPC